MMCMIRAQPLNKIGSKFNIMTFDKSDFLVYLSLVRAPVNFTLVPESRW